MGVDTVRWERLHRAWLADRLRMTNNGDGAGIDLLDNTWGVALELKTHYRRNKQVFVVHADKDFAYADEHPGLELLFGFLRYDVVGSPRVLGGLAAVESNITRREVTVMPYDWVRGYPVCRSNGTSYLYVHQNDMDSLSQDSFVNRELDEASSLKVYRGTVLADSLEERFELPF